MAGLNLTIKIDDLKARELFDDLERFDALPMWEDIGEYLTSETARRFDREIDAEGNRLKPSRRAELGGGKTLVEYGHLRDSYSYVTLLDRTGIEFGSNLDYAAIHQFGGKTGRGHRTVLPPRAILGINADDEREIEDIVLDHVRGLLR